MNKANISKPNKFLRLLRQLQRDIYGLDYYLESKWRVKEKVLEEKWERIFTTLSKFGISNEDRKKWCNEILIYQKQELALRKKVPPTQHSMEYFYYYKSCDVRLIRKLIYRADPSLKKLIAPGDWTDFDYLTEVNDDILDLFEDLKVYNCNRFLFSLIQSGRNKTRQEYSSFISGIQNEMRHRLDSEKDENQKWIFRETDLIAEDTQKLLESRLQDIKMTKVRKAIINRKW